MLVGSIAPRAGANPPNTTFQGVCVGTASSGLCVLDEPEGNDPAVHGTVQYARVGDTMSFTINALDNVQEVQICMQDTEAFAQGANVCAGIHGHHVAFSALPDAPVQPYVEPRRRIRKMIASFHRPERRPTVAVRPARYSTEC